MYLEGEGRLLIICSGAKVQRKTREGVEGKGMANQWTRDKVQIGFEPRSRGHLFNSLPGALLLLANANLALAGSGNLVALAFPDQTLAEQGFW